MPKKTFTPEQIVSKLRQIEVALSQGKTVPLACKEVGIVEQTFYRWRKEYGGLQVEQAKKLKPRWTSENRPYVDTSKPATERNQNRVFIT